jgi:Mor family transcriptional regulator
MKFTGKRTKVFDRLVELVGIEATRKILIEYGGRSIYIPKVDIFLGRQRNWRIVDEYEKGLYTQRELAEKWSLSQSQIQRIISETKEKRKQLVSSNNR